MAWSKTDKSQNKIYLLFLISILTSFSICADTPLTITSGRGEPFVNSDHNGFYDLIVKNMFKRIGIEAKTILLPSERSLINANTGVDDGNIARIKGIEKKYTNLVMVPEKIIDFDFVAFTNKKQFEIDNWESLKPYNVTFINGWKLFEKKVKHYKSLSLVQDADKLFGLLNSGRADIALYDRLSGLWWLKQHTTEISYQRLPIEKYKLYLYVHKKHKNLVPELSTALKAMKQDGTYQQIYDQSLGSLLN